MEKRPAEAPAPPPAPPPPISPLGGGKPLPAIRAAVKAETPRLSLPPPAPAPAGISGEQLAALLQQNAETLALVRAG
eukprot:SAG11_NODE_4458_length_1888_cov_1.441587_3_plen_77_part_00